MNEQKQAGWKIALLVAVAVVVLETLFGALLSRMLPGTSILLVGIITGATLSVLAGLMLTWLGWWRALGIAASLRPKQLLWFLPFFIYGLLPLAAGVRATANTFLVGIIFAALISFWKLSVLALLFQSLVPLGRWRTVAFTALLYGAIHLLGGLLVGGALLPTLLLALSYVLLAWAILAVRLRTGALWPAMIANTLLLASAVATQASDAPNLAPSVASIMPAVVISAILAIYGFVVLTIRRRTISHAVSPA